MRTLGLGFMLLLAGTAAGQEAGTVKVAIHIQGSHKVDLLALLRAKQHATAMFETARIRPIWKMAAPEKDDHCCAARVFVRLTVSTPAGFRPGAFAYAFPYDNEAGVTILYDRVARVSRRFEYALAHIIVHEVTHILQGVATHAESGVMKASWTDEEYRQMERNPLPFERHDIDLIHLSLERRASAKAR